MIDLYIQHSCPFCQKVLRALEPLALTEGEDYRIVEAGPGTPGRLIVQQVGGKGMVPFLVDETLSMYESDDIIAYLRGKAA